VGKVEAQEASLLVAKGAERPVHAITPGRGSEEDLKPLEAELANGVKRDHLGAEQTGNPQSIGFHCHVVASRAKLEQKCQSQDRRFQDHERDLKLVMAEVTDADCNSHDHYRVVED